MIGVVPLTMSAARTPIHARLTKQEIGLEADLTALVDHARFLDRMRLRPGAAGRLIAVAQSRLDRNLARVMGL